MTRKTLALILALLPLGAAGAQVPPALTGPNDRPLLTLAATGVQIYECRSEGGAAPSWVFKAPRADLMQDGKVVGRHYAGPTWELNDGSRITGKVVASVPAPQAATGPQGPSIPWLRLAVTSASGTGVLSKATVVQRIDTRGGVLAGPCPTAGIVAEAVYQADYVFLRDVP